MGSSTKTLAPKCRTMSLKVVGRLAALLLVVGKIEANERPAACVVYFSVLEHDEVPVPVSTLKMNKAQSSWYEKHGDRDKYAGICYVENGAPDEAPLYAIVWGEHLVSEPYIFIYETTQQVNGGGNATKADQNGNINTTSGGASSSAPYSHPSAGTAKDYVAGGWLAVWDPKTPKDKGSFVPIAPLHNDNPTDLTSASTSLLKDAMDQISQREKERLAVAAKGRDPHKTVKGGNSRDERNGWTEITITPIKNGQPGPTEPSSIPPQISPDAAQPTVTVPEYSSGQSSAVPSTVAVSSTPPGADIFIDEDFVGNTPSTINVTAGRHVITVKKSGFQNWVRIVNFYGGLITLNAELAGGTNEMSTAAPPEMSQSTKESAAAGVSTNSSGKLVGWIGVSAKNGRSGAVVTNVTAEGPAAHAGLHVGDIILSLNGRMIKGKNFEMEVAGLKPGTRVPVDYIRGSSSHEIWITVGSKN
jgi:PDZ domain/PEGA domain